ncbi:MAG: TolC family protein, partial [Chitinophagales bacterium]|nr:TolC family protein [Chitinophagales bacterium]
KRRAALVQAKLYEKMTQQELILAINEFLLQAENLYWHWVMQYRILKIQKEVLSRNQDRFEFTKKQYEFGEKPAIDTTEIYSQMIFFEMQINESSLDFQNLSLEIKQYLWLDNLVPYDFSNVLIPRDTLNLKDSIDYNFFYDALLNSSESFAALTYYKRKGELLEAERKAKFQDILPKLDFEYQIYNRRLNEMPFLPVFHSNFQYGLKFEYPLFARAASNQLKITKLKMVQNQLDYRIKENELQVKVNTLKNDLDNLIVQIQSMQTNISNYKKLLKAEENRLEFGESSFFLINSRETKLYEALEKLVKLQTKYRQNYNKFKWLYESLNK